MNTKNTNRLIRLAKESPEAREVLDTIHDNLLVRMKPLLNNSDRDNTQEGKLEGYMNIQDKLARIISEAKK